VKKIATIAFLFLCGGALYAQSAPKLTVADYFGLLPEKHRSFWDYKLTLKNAGGKWTCPETQGQYGFDDPLVDTRNGYIKFSQGGGGSTERVIALFNTEDKRNILGIRYNQNDGATCNEISVAFLERTGDTWTDVTGKVLPKLEYTQFLKKQYATRKFSEREMKAITNNFQLDYALPRLGTMVKVTPVIDRRCAGTYPGEAEMSFIRGMYIYFGGAKNLSWDARAGVFTLKD
jgi:hypothetical protein